MFPPQDEQDIFKLSARFKVMVARQCGQGIVSPKRLVANSTCPPQAVQDIFRDRTSTVAPVLAGPEFATAVCTGGLSTLTLFASQG